MRKLVIAFAASAALLATCPGARALDLELENRSKTSIQHLYLSAVGEKKWGDDQLGDGSDDTVDPGDSYTLSEIEPGRYDLKLVAGDGTECVIPNVRFGDDKVWTVTEKMLDSCGK